MTKYVCESYFKDDKVFLDIDVDNMETAVKDAMNVYWNLYCDLMFQSIKCVCREMII